MARKLNEDEAARLRVRPPKSPRKRPSKLTPAERDALLDEVLVRMGLVDPEDSEDV